MDKLEDIESHYLNKLKSKDFVVFYDKNNLEFLFQYGHESIHCHKNFLSFSVLGDGETYDFDKEDTMEEFAFLSLDRGFKVQQKSRLVLYNFNLKEDSSVLEQVESSAIGLPHTKEDKKEKHNFTEITSAIRFFIFQHIKNYSNYKEKKEDKKKNKLSCNI